MFGNNFIEYYLYITYSVTHLLGYSLVYRKSLIQDLNLSLSYIYQGRQVFGTGGFMIYLWLDLYSHGHGFVKVSNMIKSTYTPNYCDKNCVVI